MEKTKVRQEAITGLETALNARALRDKTINMANAEKCMEELKNYILKLEEATATLKYPPKEWKEDDAPNGTAEEMWYLIMNDTREQHTARLSRILQGLPAFE